MQTSADRNLAHLYPAFASKVAGIITEMNAWCHVHMVGYTCMMVEGLRSAAYQHSLYEQGRTTKGSIVTQRDGYRNPSVHQSGLAADLVPIKGNQINWNPPQSFWDYLGHCARERGLVYGGDWAGFTDIDHIQVKETDAETFRAARAWLADQGLA